MPKIIARKGETGLPIHQSHALTAGLQCLNTQLFNYAGGKSHNNSFKQPTTCEFPLGLSGSVLPKHQLLTIQVLCLLYDLVEVQWKG